MKRARKELVIKWPSKGAKVPKFTTSARPPSVDPALLALEPAAAVAYVENIGSSKGSGFRRADAYIAEIRARIKRQAEGFFTVGEAAQVLADVNPDIHAAELVLQMRSASVAGKLIIRNYGDRLPVRDQSDIHEAFNLVKVGDMDAWLLALGADYQFPKVEPSDAAPPPKVGRATTRRDVWWLKTYDVLEMAQNIGERRHVANESTSNTEIAKEIATRIKSIDESNGKHRPYWPHWDTVRGDLTGWRFSPKPD